MSSMEDLIATISGGMHVSQEAYELEKVKAHLARTLVIPVIPIPLSPANQSRPLPPSRSTSRTRPPTQGYAGYPSHQYHPQLDPFSQPFPSPADRFNILMDDATPATAPLSSPNMRPILTRSSSYGFTPSQPTPTQAQTYSEPGSPMGAPGGATGFESDAFASLWQSEPNSATSQWSQFTSDANSSSPSQWAAFYSSGTGFGAAYQKPQMVVNANDGQGGATNHPSTFHAVEPCEVSPPFAPRDVDDMMDEDMAEDMVEDELDDDDEIDHRLGRGSMAHDPSHYAYQRGRW